MKGKDILTKRYNYEHNELDSVAEMLEQKAAEGWELTSKTGNAFGFRKCQPKKVKISVELVLADQNDGERKRFIEYCEASGWKHIFDDGKIQIFETEDMDAEPIHSEPELKLALIQKKCWKMRIMLPLIMVILDGFLCVKLLFPIEADSLSRWNSLLPYIGLPLMGLLMLIYLVDYVIWYKGAKNCVKKGEPPAYKKTKVTSIADKVMLIYIFGGMWGTLMLDIISSGDIKEMIVYGGSFCIAGLFFLLFPRLSAKYNEERSGNLALYIVCAFFIIIVITAVQAAFSSDPSDVSAEEMPLTIADLGITVEKETSFWKSKEGTVIAKSLFASETIQKAYLEDAYGLLEGINYLVQSTAYDWAYDMILEECLSSYVDDYVEVTEPAFGANQVYYSQEEKQWLLLYDACIIEFGCSFELTDQQKALVAERLNCE